MFMNLVNIRVIYGVDFFGEFVYDLRYFKVDLFQDFEIFFGVRIKIDSD